jgi:hypothetical protein
MSEQPQNSPDRGPEIAHTAPLPYVTPMLLRLGDIRSITLGGSPFGAESGSGGTRKNAGT